MKKSLLVFAALFLFSVAGAQKVEIMGGPSLSYIKYPSVNKTIVSGQIGGRSKLMPKFHIGLNVIFPLAADIREETSFYGSTGLFFAGKGYEINKPYEIDLPLYTAFYQKGYGYSLDLPIHFGYNFQIVDNFAIFAEAGVTASMGLFGRWKAQYKFSEDYSQDYEGAYYGNEKAENTFGFKRLDVACGGKIGVLLNERISVGVSADYGFVNLGSSPSYARSINIYLSVGYRF